MTKDAIRFTLRINKALKSELKEASEKMGISANSLIIQILWDWIEKQERGKNEKIQN